MGFMTKLFDSIVNMFEILVVEFINAVSEDTYKVSLKRTREKRTFFKSIKNRKMVYNFDYAR